MGRGGGWGEKWECGGGWGGVGGWLLEDREPGRGSEQRGPEKTGSEESRDRAGVVAPPIWGLRWASARGGTVSFPAMP